MEVHPHPHAEKKGFKGYFLEFLMIFLAVTMGFIAESFREHLTERSKERKYMSSLVKDLEYDNLQFKSYIADFEDRLPFFDSVFHFLNDPAAFSNKLPFKVWSMTDVLGTYIPAEPTIQQLKNSGNLRLLENKNLLDSVLIYDSHIQGVYLNHTKYVLEFHKHLIEVKEKVYDMSKFSNYLDDFSQDKVNENSDYSFSLISKDRLAINELFNNYIELKAAIVFHISNLKEISKEAGNLLTFIKKEYHMK